MFACRSSRIAWVLVMRRVVRPMRRRMIDEEEDEENEEEDEENEEADEEEDKEREEKETDERDEVHTVMVMV